MAIERAMSYDSKVIAMREAIDQMATAVNVMRIAAHRLINADLYGAKDAIAPALYEMHKAQAVLENQCRDLLSAESEQGWTPSDANPQEVRDAALMSIPALALSRTRRGRRRGINIRPGSVRQAREQSGLSLAQVAGREVTRTAVWYIERGRVRPSLETLEVIARRTGKPLDWFLP